MRNEVEAGSLIAIEFDEPDMWRPLGVLTRRSARISPALREFLNLVEKTELDGPGAEPKPRSESDRR